MKNKLYLLILPFLLLLTSCGSDRGNHAVTEWPAAIWTFDVSGEPTRTYSFSGGALGDMFVASGPHAGATGTFTYQKTGDNNGLLTVVIDTVDISEVFQLSFASSTNGSFNLTRSDLRVNPPTVNNYTGTFSR
jgi:hypothetical protein